MTDDLPIPAPTEIERPPSGVLALRQAIVALDDQRQAMTERKDVTNLAWGAADLAAVIADLQTLRRQVTADIATIVAEGYEGRGRLKVDIPGLGRVEVPSGNERKNWQSRELLRKVVWDVVFDPETGGYRYDTANEMVDAIIDAVERTMPVSGSTSWKVGQFDKATETWTGLRGQGIEPDDWCDVEAKPPLAVVPKLK